MTELLRGLYKQYHYSPKAWRELRELAEILNIKIWKPADLGGTRWLPHIENALHTRCSVCPCHCSSGFGPHSGEHPVVPGRELAVLGRAGVQGVAEGHPGGQAVGEAHRTLGPHIPRCSSAADPEPLEGRSANPSDGSIAVRVYTGTMNSTQIGTISKSTNFSRLIQKVKLLLPSYS